jgi:hypothetical protein
MNGQMWIAEVGKCLYFGTKGVCLLLVPAQCMQLEYNGGLQKSGCVRMSELLARIWNWNGLSSILGVWMCWTLELEISTNAELGIDHQPHPLS